MLSDNCASESKVIWAALQIYSDIISRQRRRIQEVASPSQTDPLAKKKKKGYSQKKDLKCKFRSLLHVWKAGEVLKGFRRGSVTGFSSRFGKLLPRRGGRHCVRGAACVVPRSAPSTELLSQRPAPSLPLSPRRSPWQPQGMIPLRL